MTTTLTKDTKKIELGRRSVVGYYSKKLALLMALLLTLSLIHI